MIIVNVGILALQDALGVDAFNVSSEALVADSLFDAYRAADEAAIKKLILSKPIFTELDNQVSFMQQCMTQPNASFCSSCTCVHALYLAIITWYEACMETVGLSPVFCRTERKARSAHWQWYCS